MYWAGGARPASTRLAKLILCVAVSPTCVMQATPGPASFSRTLPSGALNNFQTMTFMLRVFLASPSPYSRQVEDDPLGRGHMMEHIIATLATKLLRAPLLRTSPNGSGRTSWLTSLADTADHGIPQHRACVYILGSPQFLRACCAL